MTRIVHFLDAALGWEQEFPLAQLLQRLPADRFVQSVLTLSPGPIIPAPLALREATVLPFLRSIPWLGAPVVRKALRRLGAELVHAWGVDAAEAAAASALPLIIHLFDPRLSAREIKRIRAVGGSRPFGIACASATVRRRLIEGGIPPQDCAVIRPGLDFGWLGRQRRTEMRRRLHLGERDYVVIVADPATRTGGHLEAAFACALASFLIPEMRIIVPGESAEVARIQRLFALQPRPEVLLCPGGDHPFLPLLCCADVLIAAPFGDASSSAIAWAMGAGVAVIGVADYSIAELIAHKVNGLLFKTLKGESRAVTLAKQLVRRELHGKGLEAARGQAYEVFGMRRNVDQHIKLYENVIAGKPASEGIVDSAMSA